MLGNFDETVSVKDFLHHADTGIGTCAGLDGEAVFEDGVAYKATADGKVIVMKPEDGVAFGTVAKFDESVPAVELRGIADIEAMKKTLAPYVEGNQNIFYMIKATGEFKAMHVRSCFASQKPYPTLSEVAKNQREFHFANTYGTVIAVWCPRYVNGINLPGWHFHYLSGDKTQGGHILGLSADHLTLKINQIERFDLTLPRNPEFARRDLCEDLSAKTAAVEGVKKYSGISFLKYIHAKRTGMQTRASPFCVQHLLSAAQSLLFVLTVMYDHTHRVRLRLERHTAAAANSVPDVAAVLVFL